MSSTAYTFKANRLQGRHGWLRLTPAYSVHLVEELLAGVDPGVRVLDPFCGTGTTALVCATRGIACDTVDINPFLIWLARAKTSPYAADDRESAIAFTDALKRLSGGGEWQPPIYAIEKWWDQGTLSALAAIRAAIASASVADACRDLLKVAFCRTLIRRSRASFRHQSMSFQHDVSREAITRHEAQADTLDAFRDDVSAVCESEPASLPLIAPRILAGDARRVSRVVGEHGALPEYGVVITSPPYPNRMSYVRELRPYMYWLGYLDSAADAGELDWKSIGGTWGRATSNLNKWECPPELPLPAGRLTQAITRIEQRHQLLGRYVQKYVVDTAAHLESLRPLLAPGARVTYIVGNSRFFDTLLDTEMIYAALLAQIGLREVHITRLRKRTSKRELYEFAVSARA